MQGLIKERLLGASWSFVGSHTWVAGKVTSTTI